MHIFESKILGDKMETKIMIIIIMMILIINVIVIIINNNRNNQVDQKAENSPFPLPSPSQQSKDLILLETILGISSKSLRSTCLN